MQGKRLILFALGLILLSHVPARAQVDDNNDKLTWAAGYVEKYSGLPLTNSITLEFFDDKERMKEVFRDFFHKDFPGDSYWALNAVMSKFGFSLFDEESEDEIIDDYIRGVLGVFDAETKSIYVVSASLYEQLKEERWDECNIKEVSGKGVWSDWYTKNMSDFTLVHEATHASEDELFDLFDIHTKFEHNDDANQAIKTVIEGLAVVVGDMFEDHSLNYIDDYLLSISFKWDLSFFTRVDERIENASDDKYGSCKDDMTFLWWLGRFPYFFGDWFMMKMHGLHGGKYIETAFQRCPLSSEQILTSDKYFSEKDEDRPTFINLPSFDDIIDTDEWRYLDYNSMGQLKLYLLCRDLYYDPDTECQPMAEGWDGDRYVVWRRSDDEILIAWYTTWDNIDDAEEFYSFYQLANKKKNISSGKSSSGDDYNMTLADEDSMFIQIRGADVIILEGPLDEDGFFEFADLLWDSEKYEATYDICTMTAAEFNDGYAGYTGEDLDDNEPDEGEDEEDEEED